MYREFRQILCEQAVEGEGERRGGDRVGVSFSGKILTLSLPHLRYVCHGIVGAEHVSEDLASLRGQALRANSALEVVSREFKHERNGESLKRRASSDVPESFQVPRCFQNTDEALNARVGGISCKAAAGVGSRESGDEEIDEYDAGKQRTTGTKKQPHFTPQGHGTKLTQTFPSLSFGEERAERPRTSHL